MPTGTPNLDNVPIEKRPVRGFPNLAACDNCKVSWQRGRPISLTGRETDVLILLKHRRPRETTLNEVLRHLYGNKVPHTHYQKVQVLSIIRRLSACMRGAVVFHDDYTWSWAAGAWQPRLVSWNPPRAKRKASTGPQHVNWRHPERDHQPAPLTPATPPTT